MHFYKMLIAYDGTDYYGWQQQPDKITIAGLLEKSFTDVFKRRIALVGASRTDAGVHALGQVARFILEQPIPAEKLLFAWNNVLPDAILIRSLEETTEEFHPQRAVESKTYYYHFFTEQPLPFLARFGFYQGAVDLAHLQAAFAVFVGSHDYRSFCTGYESETCRTITSITLHYFKQYNAYQIAVTGPSFARHMIRRIVGACLQVAAYKQPLDLLSTALAQKNPEQPFHTAPAQGLLLHSITYSSTVQPSVATSIFTPDA